MTVTDKDILDCLRTGCRTAPDIVLRLHGLDGTGTARDQVMYRQLRSYYNRRLRSLTKYRFVRRVGMEQYGSTARMAYEVIE